MDDKPSIQELKFKCSKCGKIKLSSEFYRRKDNQKYRNECKKCQVLADKEWARKNPEKTRLASREYYNRNRKKCNNWTREWEKKNPNKVKIMRIKNSKNHPETKGYLRHKFCANSRNFIPLPREVWIEIVKKPCFYCNNINNTLGIDRIDNNIGYTKENAVSCCGICNRMKMNSTFNDFLNRCYMISNNHPIKKE